MVDSGGRLLPSSPLSLFLFETRFVPPFPPLVHLVRLKVRRVPRLIDSTFNDGGLGFPVWLVCVSCPFSGFLNAERLLEGPLRTSFKECLSGFIFHHILTPLITLPSRDPLVLPRSKMRFLKFWVRSTFRCPSAPASPDSVPPSVPGLLFTYK